MYLCENIIMVRLFSLLCCSLSLTVVCLWCWGHIRFRLPDATVRENGVQLVCLPLGFSTLAPSGDIHNPAVLFLCFFNYIGFLQNSVAFSLVSHWHYLVLRSLSPLLLSFLILLPLLPLYYSAYSASYGMLNYGNNICSLYYLSNPSKYDIPTVCFCSSVSCMLVYVHMMLVNLRA